jgi:hypothetical protein
MRSQERDPEWVTRRRGSEFKGFASEHVWRLRPDIGRAEHRKSRNQGERRCIQF